MNKEELTKKIMRGLRESLNESIKPSDIYDDGKSLVDGSKDDITIASVWDDGSVKFRKSVSKEEREAYKKAILKNKKLVDRFDIKDDSFINESKAFDPRNNKNHKAAYNSFVKWFDRWKGKLDRDELRAMIKKVSADALGDNLDAINEARVPARIEDADQHKAEDIFLTYMHTREIYDHYINPMADNLLIKLRKGQELSFDVLVRSSIIEKHAKAAIDEYRRMNGRIMVDTATRKALKAKIAEYLIDLANDDYAFEQHDMESNLHK